MPSSWPSPPRARERPPSTPPSRTAAGTRRPLNPPPSLSPPPPLPAPPPSAPLASSVVSPRSLTARGRRPASLAAKPVLGARLPGAPRPTWPTAGRPRGMSSSACASWAALSTPQAAGSCCRRQHWRARVRCLRYVCALQVEVCFFPGRRWAARGVEGGALLEGGGRWFFGGVTVKGFFFYSGR